MVIWVTNFQTELIVEICSKSLVGAIGKNNTLDLDRTPIEIKLMQNGLCL